MVLKTYKINKYLAFNYYLIKNVKVEIYELIYFNFFVFNFYYK